MIVSDEYRFCFIHIPKCAGSSVRDALEPYDSRHGYYWLTKEYPGQGMLHFAHLTPRLLRKYFSDEFERIRDYPRFALIRDPFDRFSSSFKQFLSENKGKQLGDLSNREIRSELEKVIAALSQGAKLNPYYVHFTPQSDFVYFNGEQYIGHVYPMENIASLYSDIEALIGRSLSEGDNEPAQNRKNMSSVYRSEFMRRALSGLKPHVADRLPVLVKDILRPLLFTSPSIRKLKPLESCFVKDFIKDYYGEDISLYNSLK